MNHYLFAILFFLPAGYANVAPILAKRIPILKHWTAPIDMGMKYRRKRLLGKNKSWRGLITGVLAGGLTGWVLYPLINQTGGPLEHFLLGATIGFGALLGDAVESFFKRQRGVKSGDSWLLFDQLDYVLGSMLFSLIFIRLDIRDYLAVIAFYFFGHLVMAYLGFLLGLKDKPL
jgi:hypothetical protein